jgi:hypothetical protein
MLPLAPRSFHETASLIEALELIRSLDEPCNRVGWDECTHTESETYLELIRSLDEPRWRIHTRFD